jgi:hypothetical protein
LQDASGCLGRIRWMLLGRRYQTWSITSFRAHDISLQRRVWTWVMSPRPLRLEIDEIDQSQASKVLLFRLKYATRHRMPDWFVASHFELLPFSACSLLRHEAHFLSILLEARCFTSGYGQISPRLLQASVSAQHFHPRLCPRQPWVKTYVNGCRPQYSTPLRTVF